MSKVWRHDMCMIHRGLTPGVVAVESNRGYAVGDAFNIYVNDELLYPETITQVEPPGECKRGDLPSSAIGKWKIHFTRAAPVSLQIGATSARTILVDWEDVSRVRSRTWYKYADGFWRSSKNNETTTLGQFLLYKPEGQVKQRKYGRDWTKANLYVFQGQGIKARAKRAKREGA